MIALGHVRAAQGMVHRLDVVHGAGPLLGQHGQELLHHPGHHHGVVGGPVMVELGQTQVVGDDVQLEALQLRQQGLG